MNRPTPQSLEISRTEFRDAARAEGARCKTFGPLVRLSGPFLAVHRAYHRATRHLSVEHPYRELETRQGYTREVNLLTARRPLSHSTTAQEISR